MGRLAPILICALITLACIWCGLVAIRDADAPMQGIGATEPPGDTAVAPKQQRPTDATREITRSQVTSATESADFTTLVGRLVDLGIAMWKASEQGDTHGVESANRAAEGLLVALHNTCPDAGERALDLRTRNTPTGATVRDQVRRHVLERVLRDVLAMRWRSTQNAPDRRSIDDLVSAMLAGLSMHLELAQALGMGLLVDQPYLGPAHEAAVLQLAELSTEQPGLREVAAGLLRTLWRNLQESGAQSSDRLAGLALLLLEDGNEARRLAALRQLVVDPRYRELVIDQIVRMKDSSMVRSIAQAVANEVEPATALRVLERLIGVGGEELLGAFVLLGSRDPGLLVTEYDQILAAGVRPNLRAQLITGASAQGDALAREAAKVAFALDPDPGVRMRALFALASDPDPKSAEAALNTALDDRSRRDDPEWIAGIALALQNLAANGAVAALERLGSRLLDHPALDDVARAGLQALLAEHLPSGR